MANGTVPFPHLGSTSLVQAAVHRLSLNAFGRWWIGFGYWAVQDVPTWYFVGLNAASLVAITQKGKEMFGFCFILLDFFRRREGQVILQSVLQGAPGLLGSAKVAFVLLLMFGCLGFWFFEVNCVVVVLSCGVILNCCRRARSTNSTPVQLHSSVFSIRKLTTVQTLG